MFKCPIWDTIQPGISRYCVKWESAAIACLVCPINANAFGDWATTIRTTAIRWSPNGQSADGERVNCLLSIYIQRLAVKYVFRAIPPPPGQKISKKRARGPLQRRRNSDAWFCGAHKTPINKWFVDRRPFRASKAAECARVRRTPFMPTASPSEWLMPVQFSAHLKSVRHSILYSYQMVDNWDCSDCIGSAHDMICVVLCDCAMAHGMA